MTALLLNLCWTSCSYTCTSTSSSSLLNKPQTYSTAPQHLLPLCTYSAPLYLGTCTSTEPLLNLSTSAAAELQHLICTSSPLHLSALPVPLLNDLCTSSVEPLHHSALPAPLCTLHHACSTPCTTLHKYSAPTPLYTWLTYLLQPQLHLKMTAALLLNLCWTSCSYNCTSTPPPLC